MGRVTTVTFRPGAEATSNMRNGMVRTTGLHLQDFHHGEILLAPINSKGDKASGSLALRSEAIPEIIRALAEIYLDNHPQDETLLRQQLEAAIGLKPNVAPSDEDALDEDQGFRP